jgi:3-oxoacyl-[acyl-carrier-protein] synthase II
MSDQRRVVITGMGCISPVGNDVPEAWSAVVSGRSGIGPLTAIDSASFSSRIAGEIKDFDLERYLSAKDARKSDAFIHYGVAAAVQAIEDAGLPSHPDDADRYGLAIGSGIGGIDTIEKAYQSFISGGSRKISPFFVPGCIINMIAGQVSIRYGYQGPNISVVTACASATHSIGQALRMIAYGDADVMIAGGAEYATTPTAVGGFCAARALSTRNDEPQAASRPWDVNRDGFVLGNGAGVVVLETLERARARDAKIYAEVIGFGMSGDAHHITAPSPDGAGARRCMQAALNDASVSPTEVDYINAHGTSTPAGDVAECDAVRGLLGDKVGQVMMSSTKSMTGHLLGAAGGIETIFTAMALHDGIVPPTINLDEPDPAAAGIDLVPHEARSHSVNVALCNSFGFGGTNASLVLKKFT